MLKFNQWDYYKDFEWIWGLILLLIMPHIYEGTVILHSLILLKYENTIKFTTHTDCTKLDFPHTNIAIYSR